jgi:Protein of unknown function (DUF3995)
VGRDALSKRDVQILFAALQAFAGPGFTARDAGRFRELDLSPTPSTASPWANALIAFAGKVVPMLRPEQVASAALAALAGLHLLWATGSPWPLSDRAAFADAVVGRDIFSPRVASVGVAAALASGSVFVAGWPRSAGRVQSAGAAGVVCALSVRGVLGIVGRTDLVSPGSSSPRFRALDRRLYSPLCLTIAALAAPAAQSGRG